MLAMLDAKAHLRPRGAIGTEFVRDHDARWRGRRFQELPHEPLRRAGVSAGLNQDIENEAILIDGAPKPVLLARNRDDDFIHMPLVATCRSTPAELIGEGFAELLSPSAHGLIGHANPTRRKHLLYHPKAERKSEVEPDCIAYHLGRKAMTAV